MAADKDSDTGTDFWAVFGAGSEADEPPNGTIPENTLVAGRAAQSPPPAGRAEAGAPTSDAAASKPGGTGEQAPPQAVTEPPAFEAASDPVPRRPTAKTPGQSVTRNPEERSAHTSRPATAQFAQPPRGQTSGRRKERKSLQAPGKVAVQAHRQVEPRKPEGAAEPQTSQPTDPAWLTAEQIAGSVRPRIPEIWTEVLTRYTNGDETMARRVYDVLSGLHVLGELWRDERIDEVHIQGTEVTVCGRDGMYQVPGFPNLAAAQRAVAAFKVARRKLGVVSRIGNAVVVSRHPGAGPDATWLLAGQIITDDQLSQVTMALQHMRAVTVTGPAARIVVRALGSLIPAGSRVFLGSYATLPVGCITAATPLEADYVVGVRPGALAEEMAAEGQVGALVANPERRIRAALTFVVSGQSAAPGKLSQMP